jgi:hypothetical protein
MTTYRHRITIFVAVLAVALAAAAGGALGSDNRGDYASPELIQLGSGPGGPPAASVSRVRQTANVGTARDYGSAEIIRLGHGPGGPPASGGS